MYKAPLRASAGLFLIHPLTYVGSFKNFWNFKAETESHVNAKEQYDIQLIKDKFSKLRDHYGVPKYPMVLCHGLSGFDTLTLFEVPQVADANADLEEVAENVKKSGISVNYWHGIEEALTKAGASVIIARVPPFGSIDQRAERLDALLKEKCSGHEGKEPGERLKINIVGHSMGGLDARYLISKIQNEKSPYEVVSLTTIGTPHHGSECADFVMDLVSKDAALEAICPKAIPQLTTHFMKGFNKDVINDSKVSYFSYGASMPPQGVRVFRATYEIIKHEIQKRGGTHFENDGMVSVESSRWGEYLGTLSDVDHLDLINWTNRIKTTVDQLVFDKTPTFNPIALYLDIAENLSKRGF
ncbi:hypothetical protein FT663_03916 [Candidozyma haemuli var. vulneris]|uniref:DUF676 domain-containing protein n=1 Tax=Candidozyma haemuli TaxID=45357 RepID=A0A2V1AZ86_9ASCO|nr:hypothetical protein CXQ85_002927 [[Candida] haemuloni]KAF3987459.1 hypothetical protein FT662_03979 [[Candida] haemuloni var. vulneris]KAF3988748.1 hypothetical protein FT663_03916 [[Candida] haemuloni var. vulneris]PVH23198.1 hypothetical protein CXQ85_002927 [[Candida] haemuloni]